MSIGSDSIIYDSLGYNGSNWRDNGGVPDFATYYTNYQTSLDQPNRVYFIGTPYLVSEDLSEPIDLSSIYGEVFWNTFFETIFPQIYTTNYLAEKSTGTSGGYFRQLYEIAMRDFYDSFFCNRDNSDDSLSQELISSANWKTLSEEQQRVVIKKYLFSRTTVANSSYIDETGSLVFRQYTGNLFLENLNLRATNLFFFVASLMVGLMEKMQSNTINASSYTTRLAEIQKKISTEMSSTSYLYQSPSSLTDYGTVQKNSQNSLTLENLRQFRDLMQKKTDRSSSFLQTSQEAVEEQGSKGLEFLKKGKELSQLFFRSL